MQALSRLIILASAVQAYVRVISPDRLRADVDYKISTFGLVDYQNGKTIEIKPWNSLDGCDPPTDDVLSYGSNIGFLMKKGECSFRRQAVNGRRGGAYLVLTYEDSGEDGKLNTPTSEEETRDLELPPVIMISRKNGEAIREAISKGEKVTMFFDWDIKIFKPPINVDYLYSVVDYKSVSIYHKLMTFQLEDAMNPVGNSTKNLVNLVNIPKFYRRKDFNLSMEDSKAYCIDKTDICVNPHPSVKLAQPMEEVMVAGFLFCLQIELDNGNRTQNLQFMTKLLGDYAELLKLNEGKDQVVNLTGHFEKSLQPADIEKLSHGKKSYIKQVTNCLASNFGTDYTLLKPSNRLLEKIVEEGSKRRTRVPALYLGGHLVRGDLTPMTGLSALCDVIPLDIRPTQCASVEQFLLGLTSQLEVKEDHGADVPFALRLLYTLLASALIFGLTYLVGSYMLEKNLQKDITKDIDESLERYYQIQNTSLEIVSKDDELKAANT